MTITDEELDLCLTSDSGTLEKRMEMKLKELRHKVAALEEEVDRLKRQHFRLVRSCGIPVDIKDQLNIKGPT